MSNFLASLFFSHVQIDSTADKTIYLSHSSSYLEYLGSVLIHFCFGIYYIASEKSLLTNRHSCRKIRKKETAVKKGKAVAWQPLRAPWDVGPWREGRSCRMWHVLYLWWNWLQSAHLPREFDTSMFLKYRRMSVHKKNVIIPTHILQKKKKPTFQSIKWGFWNVSC